MIRRGGRGEGDGIRDGSQRGGGLEGSEGGGRRLEGVRSRRRLGRIGRTSGVCEQRLRSRRCWCHSGVRV